MLKINYSSNTIILLFIVIIVLYILFNRLDSCNISQKQNETFSGLNNKVFIQTSNNKCNNTYRNTNSLTNINHYNTNEFNELLKQSQQNRPPLCSNDNNNKYCNVINDNKKKEYEEKKKELENKYLIIIKEKFPHLFETQKIWTFLQLYLNSFENLLTEEEQLEKKEIDDKYTALFEELKEFLNNINNNINNTVNGGDINSVNGINNNNTITNTGILKKDLIKYNKLRRTKNKLF